MLIWWMVWFVSIVIIVSQLLIIPLIIIVLRVIITINILREIIPFTISIIIAPIGIGIGTWGMSFTPSIIALKLFFRILIIEGLLPLLLVA